MKIYQLRIVDSYFRFMKNWSTELKKHLIFKLSQSIDQSSSVNRDFSGCFGTWEDERDAEEIIQEIYSSRVNKSEIEDF